MASSIQLAQHRRWEDWAFVILGLAIVLSPLVSLHQAPGPVIINIVASGLVILGATLFEFEKRMLIEEIIQFLFGAWTALSTFLPTYAANPRMAHVNLVLGSAVTLLAAYEIWQDSLRRAQ